MPVPIIAANWKMNKPPFDVEWTVAEGKRTDYHSTDAVDVVVFPSFLDIEECQKRRLIVGAQWAHPDDSGSFTGDVSMAMLASHRINYVLCGHSERRQHHKESDEFIALQVKKALQHGVQPILCIGETADQRKMNETEKVLATQLSMIDWSAPPIIAYEPVWAIGTGLTATTEDIKKTHAFIRSVSKNTVTILYGGSVNAQNAASILSIDGVDGVLVGGASLKLEEFSAIVKTATKARHQ